LYSLKQNRDDSKIKWFLSFNKRFPYIGDPDKYCNNIMEYNEMNQTQPGPSMDKCNTSYIIVL
jgi:hypothetical protein